MKKDQGGTNAADAATAGNTTPAADITPPAADASAAVADEAATEGEQQLDPKHEWPSKGGCYVRQPDGSLKRED